MSNIFKRDDIKAGYLLVVRDKNGDESNMTVSMDKRGRLGCCTPKKYWCPVDEFNDELDYPAGRDKLCIIAVYGPTSNAFLLDNSTENRDLLWKRQEVKKMTVAEIAKALGYPVEIVEG